MKNILLKIVAVFCLTALLPGGISWADLAYTTASGDLGVITIKSRTEIGGVTRIQTGIGANRRLLSWGGGYPRAALLSSADLDGDTALVYTPGKWQETPEIQTFDEARDVRSVGASENGKSLFAGSYTAGSVVEYVTGSYEPTEREYTHVAPSGYSAHTQKVLVDGTSIYGLFRNSSASGDVSGKLVVLDGQLNARYLRGSFDVRPNPSDMARNSDGKIGIACLGATSRDVSSIQYLSNGTVSTLVSGSAYGRIETICRDSGSGFYFTGRTVSGDVSTVRLYHCDSAGAVTSLPWSRTSSFSQVLWDSDHSLLIVATDGDLMFRDNDGDQTHFTSADLGGRLTAVAVTSNPTSVEGNNNGCATVGPSFLLPLVLLPALRYNKRKKFGSSRPCDAR